MHVFTTLPFSHSKIAFPLLTADFLSFSPHHQCLQSESATTQAQVLREVFESVVELKYTPTGVPRTVALLMDRLGTLGAFDRPTDATTFGATLDALTLATHVHTDGYRLALYWVCTVWHVHKETCERLGQPAPDPVVKRVDEAKLPEGLVGVTGKLLYDTFASALGKAYFAIDSIVVAAMVEYQQQQQQGGAKAAAPAKPAASAAAATTKSPAHVIAILAEVLQAATEVKLPQAMRKQVAAQLVYCVNAGMFNAFVTRPELCTCSSGFQIRLAMSQLEDWLVRDQDAFPARKRLEHVREASNLFVMDKKILRDDEAVKAAFSALNIAQLTRLLESFRPDQLSKTGVDPAILQEMKSKAQSGSWDLQIQLDPHAWLQ